MGNSKTREVKWELGEKRIARDEVSQKSLSKYLKEVQMQTIQLL